MIRLRICVVIFLITLGFAWVPMGITQAAGTDEIKNYAIDILPQEDGSLMDTYTINWCVISNSAGPLTWFTVGMPNEQYQVAGSSGDVARVSPNNEGFDYKIRIDLPRSVNAGDCVNTTVQIHQFGMANLDSATNEISYQFTPGWFNEVPVDLLQVTWHLPSDASQVKSFDPKPATQSDSQAVWKTDLQPGEKYPITVVYDQAAFPNFNPAQAASTQAPDLSPTKSSQSTTSSTSNENTGAPVSAAPLVLPAFSLSTCICGCLILLIALIVIVLIFRLIGSAARSYRGGGYLGGYPRGGGWLGGGGGAGLGGGFGSIGGGGGSVTRRTGGGSGLFGGRGMSCACVSSGCACACAGGGRAGCSRKGFDVSSLFKDRQEKKDQ
jgi:hypothetical protein